MRTWARAIDCSGWQPADLTPILREYRPDHAIIRLYLPWERISQDHSRAQVQSVRDFGGVTIGGYCWTYADSDPVQTVNATIDLCASMGLVLPILWPDHETYNGTIPGVDWLRAFWTQCDALETPSGPYTSAEMWLRIGNPTEFADRPAWIANYSRPAGYPGEVPGLPNVVGHQYRGDPLDLSLIAAEYAGLAPDCAAVLAALDERLARRPWRALTRKETAAIRALGG